MTGFELPQIDFHAVADQAMHLPAVRALVFGSYCVVTLGVMVRYAREMMKPPTEANYWSPFVSGAFWLAVLLSYTSITTNIIEGVTHLGDSAYQQTTEDLQRAFADRVYAILSKRNTTRVPNQGGTSKTSVGLVGPITAPSGPASSGASAAPKTTKLPDPTPSTGGFADEFGAVIVMICVWLCQLLVFVVVFLVRALQMYLLGIIAAYGPILLAMASLGGIFQPLGIAWFWSLVEVSAWSITYQILFRFVGDIVPESAPAQVNYASEIFLCAVLVGAFVVIPKITAMLLRNESGAGLAAGATSIRMAQVAGVARKLQAGGGVAASGATKAVGAARNLYRRYRG